MQDTPYGQRGKLHRLAVYSWLTRRRFASMIFVTALAGGMAFGAVAAYSSPHHLASKQNHNEQPAKPKSAQAAATTQGTSSNSQSVQLDVHASSQSQQNGNTRTHTSVTVNGQPVQVPQNGSVHQDISNGQGTTSVDVSQHATGSSTNSDNTSININVDSNSSSSSSSVNDST